MRKRPDRPLDKSVCKQTVINWGEGMCSKVKFTKGKYETYTYVQSKEFTGTK